MEDLLEYIKENISLVNKNNNIHIIIGETLCENIFNSRLNCDKISFVLEKLNTTNINIENYKVYKHKNSITMVNNKKYINYCYSVTNPIDITLPNISLFCNIYNILQYDESGISIYNYDSIENMQLYQINIDNLFIIEIQNIINIDTQEQYFTIHIIIKKPNNTDKLYKKIVSILSML